MNNYEQVTQEVRDAFQALCKGRVEAAVKAEREACAKVCENIYTNGDGAECWLENAAEKIRARGNT
jgi:hypothetical protein